MLPLEALAPCITCHALHNVKRFVCIKCRDGIDRAQGEYRHCFTGYCLAHDMRSHGSDLGMGYTNARAEQGAERAPS